MTLGIEENIVSRAAVQQLIAAVVRKHTDQSVVYLDKAPVRTAEKQALLNIVEQLAVAPLSLAAIGNVFEYVNRLQAFTAGAVNFGSGNEIRAVERRVQVLVHRTAGGATERT